MKKYASATAIAAVFAIAAVVVGVYSGSRVPGSEKAVKLAFLGLTNVPSRGRYAVFVVTNAGPRHVAFDADALEYYTPHGWATNTLRNTTRRDWLCWHRTKGGGLQIGRWDDFGGDLKSGISVMFGAPVAVTNSAWRLDFYCVEQATGLHGLHDRAGDVVQRTLSVITNGAARDQTTFTGRRYHLMSQEVSD